MHRWRPRIIGKTLLHDFKLFPLVARIQRSQVPLNAYNLLPKGLNIPLICIAYGLQVLDSLLERVALAF